MRYATLLLLLLPTVALGADVTATWTNPTTRTDGSALPAAELRGTRVEHGSCNGSAFGTKAGDVLAAAGATSITFALPPGTHCLRAYARASDGGSGQLESLASNMVQKVISVAPPAPPVNLAVQQLTAYTVVKQRDRFVLAPVGTVPANTQCDPQQSVNGHYVVPRSSVTWSGSTKPQVVVAQCG